MLVRNLRLHMDGKLPKVPLASYGEAKARIPLDEGARKELLTGLDFWFTYLLYVERWKKAYWLIVAFLGAAGLAARCLVARKPALT
jgi:hypothetical protein